MVFADGYKHQSAPNWCYYDGVWLVPIHLDAFNNGNLLLKGE